jgi:hypothetical protein
MEIEALAGMAFAFLMTVTLALTIGGVILLRPLMRNLGNFLEAKAEERKGISDGTAEDWERLLSGLDSLDKRLQAIEDRQDFTEKLLSGPRGGEGED